HRGSAWRAGVVRSAGRRLHEAHLRAQAGEGARGGMGADVVLSRLVMNLGSSAARRDLANAYEMHSTLMRLVDAGAGRPLWRLELGRDGRPPELLIQTDVEPDFGALT